ncbi:MAG: hypothetical protein WCF22_11700 [Candidatus Sulfotelmatobacter sp.]
MVDANSEELIDVSAQDDAIVQKTKLYLYALVRRGCRTLSVNYHADLAAGIIEKDNRDTGSIPSASFCRGDEGHIL